MSHTPEPWSIANEDGDTLIIQAKEHTTDPHVFTGNCPGFYIANIYGGLVEHDENAHLIAAAPDIYSALKSVVTFLDKTSGIDTSMLWEDSLMRRECLDAIAKAEGRDDA